MKNLLGSNQYNTRKEVRAIAIILKAPIAIVLLAAWYSLIFFLKSFKTLKNPGAYLLFFTLFFTSTSLAVAPKSSLTTPYQMPIVIHPNMQVREIVLSLTKIEFGDSQVDAMDQLLSHESGFNPEAINPNSGACGIFQSLPCEKMLSMDIQDQIQFGFDYIKRRYGTPAQAWKEWKLRSPHWY